MRQSGKVSKTVKGALTMACEAFIDYRPRTATMVIIDQAVAIIAEYLDQV
jgi:hypothetical protein